MVSCCIIIYGKKNMNHLQCFKTQYFWAPYFHFKFYVLWHFYQSNFFPHIFNVFFVANKRFDPVKRFHRFRFLVTVFLIRGVVITVIPIVRLLFVGSFIICCCFLTLFGVGQHCDISILFIFVPHWIRKWWRFNVIVLVGVVLNCCCYFCLSGLM